MNSRWWGNIRPSSWNDKGDMGDVWEFINTFPVVMNFNNNSVLFLHHLGSSNALVYTRAHKSVFGTFYGISLIR